MALTTKQIINIAKVSEYLAQNAVTTNEIFNTGSLDPSLPQKIYAENAALAWCYTNNPTEPTLTQVANWVYQLCGYYGVLARSIVTQSSGNIIYNPTTGELLNGILMVQNQFTIGESNAPLAVGGTTFTITDSRIVAGSFLMTVDGLQIPQGATNQNSYTILYSSSSIIVTLNFPAQAGQVFIYEYNKGLATSNTSGKTLQPTLYHTFVGSASSYAFSQLINVPITDLVLVSRDTQVKQPVLTSTSNMNQIQYTPSTGTFTPPTGDVFLDGEVISVTYVSL